MSVLLGVPHTATVRAVSPARLYVFADAEEFLRSHPAIGFYLARLLAQRLNAATTYLVDLKRQFEDQRDHFGMVGEVLESLMHQQDGGSRRRRSGRTIRGSEASPAGAASFATGRSSGLSRSTNWLPAAENQKRRVALSVSNTIWAGGAPNWWPMLNTQVDPIRSTQEPSS